MLQEAQKCNVLLLSNDLVWGSNLHQKSQNFPKLSLPLALSKSNLGPNAAKSINTNSYSMEKIRWANCKMDQTTCGY